MSKHFFSIRSVGLFLALFVALGSATAAAQTTQFTYQGRLTDGSLPANGSYDFQFKLYDALAGGSQVGGTLSPTNVTVSNGIFTVTLDFGSTVFPGADRWLDISVRLAGGGGFTMLSPRQPITSTPYAIKSLSASSAASADGLSVACVNCVTSSQINSVLGSQVSGAIPVASVPAGSGNYIQNTGALQAGANFNISGNGTAGGMLSANIVNATAQFNLGGNRVLSNPGTSNIFAGINAGAANTTGFSNSFFGNEAGNSNTGGNRNSFFGRGAGLSNTTGGVNSFFGDEAGANNTTGSDNSFFGRGAGFSNQTGYQNSFFGESAGAANTTGFFNSFFGWYAGGSNTTGSLNSFFGHTAGQNSTGNANSFFGLQAGLANTTGTNNTALGASADVGAGNLNYATALGAGAVVSTSNTVVLGRNLGQDAVTVPGNLTVNGALNANGAGVLNLNANNIASGTLAVARGGTGLSSPGTAGRYLRSDGTNWTSSLLQAADLPSGSTNYIQNTTTQQAGSNFYISGNGTAGGTLAASSVSASLINTTTHYNLGGARVLGADGVNNLMAGIFAGTVNAGLGNSFFGGEAGRNNTTGDNNSFFGRLAGTANNTGFNNSFFGSGAGSANTTASWNSFFGHNAGTSTNTGNFNAFFGDSAGFANTTGTYNSFFGAQAGQNNSQGYDNVFIGDLAGFSNTTGNNNTLVGDTADVTANNLTYATAIGAEATVSTSNTIVLGRSNGSDKVRIPGLSAATATHLCINTSNQNELSTCSSSLRYKEDVLPWQRGLALVARLRPVTFNWKTNHTRDIGLIAEEVAEAEPLLVTHNDKGEIEGVKYEQLNVVLINAVNEQQSQIQRQQTQIQQQQTQLAAHQQENAILQQQLKTQQEEIASLKRLVCLSHPQAATCRTFAPQR